MTATTYRETDTLSTTAQDMMTSEQLPLATAKQSNAAAAAAHEPSLTTDIQYDEDFEYHKGRKTSQILLNSPLLFLAKNMGAWLS